MTKDEAISIVRPVPKAKYEVDVGFDHLTDMLRNMVRDYGRVDMAPDFQRGHVWTEEQQTKFIENLFRGLIPSSGLLIQWNCPEFNRDRGRHCDLPEGIQIVDGLQRVTTVLRFLAEEIKPFGKTASDFRGTPYDTRRLFLFKLRFAIHDFQRRADLLQFYLDINSGGTPHSNEEIERVRGLLESERAVAQELAVAKSPVARMSI